MSLGPEGDNWFHWQTNGLKDTDEADRRAGYPGGRVLQKSVSSLQVEMSPAAVQVCCVNLESSLGYI